MEEFCFGCAVDLQIFFSIDPLLLNEAAVGLLDLVLPQVVLHPGGVLCAIGDLPNEVAPDQVEQDARPGELHAETIFKCFKLDFCVAFGFHGL